MMRSVKSNSAIENRKPFESKRYSEFVNGPEKHSSSNKWEEGTFQDMIEITVDDKLEAFNWF